MEDGMSNVSGRGVRHKVFELETNKRNGCVDINPFLEEVDVLRVTEHLVPPKSVSLTPGVTTVNPGVLVISIWYRAP